MHEVLVNHLEGLSLPRKSVDRLTDRPDMTLDVYRVHKITTLKDTVRISMKNHDLSLSAAYRLLEKKTYPSSL